MKDRKFQISHNDTTIHVFATNAADAVAIAHGILHPELSVEKSVDLYDEDSDCYSVTYPLSPYKGAFNVSFTYWVFDLEKKNAEAEQSRSAVAGETF